MMLKTSLAILGCLPRDQTFKPLLKISSNQFSTRHKPKIVKHNSRGVAKFMAYPNLALKHFDGLYSKVYAKHWPSARLGLLSPKKPSAILNSFVDHEDLQSSLEEQNAIYLPRYYKKHLISYTRFQLKKKLFENKKARKREMMAKSQNVDPESIDPESIEVSDISDNELRGVQTTDASDGGGFSTAEDLQAMFSDRRLDDDEKYFINQASPDLSLEDFVPATELVYREEVLDEMSYYEGFRPDLDLDIEHRIEPSLELDDQLKIYTFPRLNWTRFDEPTRQEKSGLYNYYIMDGASALAVLALDIRMNDICADYCAAPGGKTLTMLMSLKPKRVDANDSSRSRLTRINRIMNQYAPDIKYVKEALNLTNRNSTTWVNPDAYDKIIVDVPCSNDRNSVEQMENNLFKRARSEERLRLPSIQADILRSALKSLRPGGALVYSTCTLSPIENDGVVQKALFQTREEGCPHKYAIMDLKEAFRPLRGLYKFKTNFLYGQQVMPSVTSNFGPMYISKIKRIK